MPAANVSTGPAEQHVDARIVLLGDDARERLARGEAQEIDLDAARGFSNSSPTSAAAQFSGQIE
jgi:hypothetical protein